MTKREWNKLVRKFGGWVEGDMARFPSVHQKDQFAKAIGQ